MPASSRSSVDLPAPLGPTTPRTSPGATVAETPASTVAAPCALYSSRAISVPAMRLSLGARGKIPGRERLGAGSGARGPRPGAAPRPARGAPAEHLAPDPARLRSAARAPLGAATPPRARDDARAARGGVRR